MTGTLPRQHFISVYFALEWQFDCLAFYISAQAISIAPVLIPCSAGGATAWLGQPAVRCNKLAAGDEGFGDAKLLLFCLSLSSGILYERKNRLFVTSCGFG